MTIQVGDKIPSATLKQMTPEGPKDDHHRRTLPRQEGCALRRARRVYPGLLAAPPARLRREGGRHQSQGRRRDRLRRGQRCLCHDGMGQGAEGRGQGAHAGRRQRRFRPRARARARPLQERSRHPLEAVFDAGGQRRRQVAQCRAVSRARSKAPAPTRCCGRFRTGSAAALPAGQRGALLSQLSSAMRARAMRVGPLVFGVAGMAAHPFPSRRRAGPPRRRAAATDRHS